MADTQGSICELYPDNYDIVLAYVKSHSPQKLRDKRIARDLKLPRKVVRACLHFHVRTCSSRDPTQLKLTFQSPLNVKRKRPVWSA